MFWFFIGFKKSRAANGGCESGSSLPRLPPPSAPAPADTASPDSIESESSSFTKTDSLQPPFPAAHFLHKIYHRLRCCAQLLLAAWGGHRNNPPPLVIVENAPKSSAAPQSLYAEMKAKGATMDYGPARHSMASTNSASRIWMAMTSASVRCCGSDLSWATRDYRFRERRPGQ